MNDDQPKRESQSLISSIAFSHSGRTASVLMFTIQVNELQPPQVSDLNSVILDPQPISMRGRGNHFGRTPQDGGSGSGLMGGDKLDLTVIFTTTTLIFTVKSQPSPSRSAAERR